MVMNSEKRCADYVKWLEARVNELFEQDASGRAWREVDKTKLPRQCFLWAEDAEKKSTWHLPYREGAGGIDPKTGMYAKAGPVNLGALRAIASAIAGGRTGKPMAIPSQVRSKITKLLKRYKIGKFKESAMDGNGKREFLEQSMARQFVETSLDKENKVIKNVAILRPTSVNRSFPKAKGREYSENARLQAAEMVEGCKAYVNHATKQELQDRGGVRDVRDLIGYYKQGRLQEGVVRGDLYYLPHQAVWLEPLVENMADKIGNSIHAFGDLSFDRDREVEVVESLDRMASVDLVTETGSTVNLFEAATDEDEEEEIEVVEEVTMEIKDLTLKELIEGRPDLIEKIEEKVKADKDQAQKIISLEEAVAKLEKENTDLKKKVDDFEVSEAARKKEERIEELIAEAKLPKEAVTDPFKASLREAKDEEGIKALIEDRKSLLANAQKGVTGMGDEKDENEDEVTESGKKKKVSDDDEEFTEAVKEAR
jgi:hypothetical protein